MFKVCVFCFKTKKIHQVHLAGAEQLIPARVKTQAVPHKLAAEPLFHKKKKIAANESEFHPAVWSGLRSERWAEICQEDIKKTTPKEC